MNTVRKVLLVILDGWGMGKADASDAIAAANTPFMDKLLEAAPHAELRTDGLHVGLPEGQMGNSEVGHLNIGAGRIVFQDLARINNALADGSLGRNAVLLQAFQKAKENGGRLHLIGLLSKGGVHSSQAHAAGLCRLAAENGVTDILVHAFSDGRDADPKSGLRYLEDFNAEVKDLPVRIASVVGRFFAMDRDKRWPRIKKAYDLLVHGKGIAVRNAEEAYRASYAAGITDEFIEPHVVVDADGDPLGTLVANDVVLCFNFRTDRCRQITTALTQEAFPQEDMRPLPLHFVTMTEYDPTYVGVQVVLHKEDLVRTLGEVVAAAGLRQIRAAETEKYPHVTFFFNGGRELPFTGEERIMEPSPKVTTYDLQPEMSAPRLAERVVAELTADGPEFVCLNFANPDMVGHTGVFDAIVKAVEVTDSCAHQVVDAARTNGYSVVIIADHGNADHALNADGSPNTAHSMNPVPIIVLDERGQNMMNGILADVAPTILDLMGLPQPSEMSGRSLLTKDRSR